MVRKVREGIGWSEWLVEMIIDESETEHTAQCIMSFKLKLLV